MAMRKLYLPLIKYSRLDSDVVESKAQTKRLEMQRISTRLKSLKDDESRISKCIDDLEVFHRDLFVLFNTKNSTSDIKKKSSTNNIKKAKHFLTEPDYSTNPQQYSFGGQEVMMNAPEVFVARQYPSEDHTVNSTSKSLNKSSANDGFKKGNQQQYSIGGQEVVMNAPEVFVVQFPPADQSEGSVVESYNIGDQPKCSSNEPDFLINQAEEDFNGTYYLEIPPEVPVNVPDCILDLSSATLNETGYVENQSEISVIEPDYPVNQPGLSVNEPDFLANQPGLSINDQDYLVNQPDSDVQMISEKMDSTENESFNSEDETDNGCNKSSKVSDKSKDSCEKSSKSSDKSSDSSDKSSDSSDKSSDSSDKSSDSSDKSSVSSDKSSDSSDMSSDSSYKSRDKSDKSRDKSDKLNDKSIKSNSMSDLSNKASQKSNNSSFESNDMSDKSNNANHISNDLSHNSNVGCQNSNYVGEGSGDIKRCQDADQKELAKDFLRNRLESKEREVTGLWLHLILKFSRFQLELRAAEKTNLTRLSFFSSQSSNFESKLQELSETVLYLDQEVFNMHSKYFDMLNGISEC